jgi:hypothetical protein
MTRSGYFKRVKAVAYGALAVAGGVTIAPLVPVVGGAVGAALVLGGLATAFIAGVPVVVYHARDLLQGNVPLPPLEEQRQIAPTEENLREVNRHLSNDDLRAKFKELEKRAANGPLSEADAERKIEELKKILNAEKTGKTPKL